jgi:tetratricopeptide (TPR) repeat protein
LEYKRTEAPWRSPIFASSREEARRRCSPRLRDDITEEREAQYHAATGDLDEAITLCQAIPYPYAEAKALYVYGQLHAAKGEPKRACERYQAALAICERLGEGLYRPYIEQDLELISQSVR